MIKEIKVFSLFTWRLKEDYKEINKREKGRESKFIAWEHEMLNRNKRAVVPLSGGRGSFGKEASYCWHRETTQLLQNHTAECTRQRNFKEKSLLPWYPPLCNWHSSIEHLTRDYEGWHPRGKGELNQIGIFFFSCSRSTMNKSIYCLYWWIQWYKRSKMIDALMNYIYYYCTICISYQNM